MKQTRALPMRSALRHLVMTLAAAHRHAALWCAATLWRQKAVPLYSVLKYQAFSDQN
jgi:hypothetical protein